MTSARITYTPRPDATPEGELNALAACFRFILDCHAKKEADGPRQAVSPVSAKGGSENDSSAKGSIP
jgi:hypothetical protein